MPPAYTKVLKFLPDIFKYSEALAKAHKAIL